LFSRAQETLMQARKLADTVSQVLLGYPCPELLSALKNPGCYKLDQHEPPQPSKSCVPAAKYDLSNTDCLRISSRYIRGLAYLQLHQGQWRQWSFRSWLITRDSLEEIDRALARLQLGRTYKIMDDQATARRWYEEFLTIWKDATPTSLS